MNPEELSAITACQNGDQERFSFLYDKYVDAIYAYAFRQTYQKELAEDLTSQTFLQALRRIETYQADKGNFSTWLYQIARNLVYQHFRSYRPTLTIDEVWEVAGKADVVKEAEQGRQLAIIKEYLESLRPSQQEVLRLRLWEELSYEEIAAITGKSESSCKMSFSRAIRQLRTELAYLVAPLLIIITTHNFIV
jgi:RNA polymerase sigma-70 factor (ECF subfamily)